MSKHYGARKQRNMAVVAVENQALADLQSELRQEQFRGELLEERLAELELGLEDVGWQRLYADFERDISREGLRRICQQAQIMWIKNPLIKRAVDVQCMYVFGQGVSVTAKDSAINDVVQTFWDDEANRAELTSHEALLLKETDLQLFGNLFFVFFTDPVTGHVRIRTIPFDEIQDIITDPEDAKRPFFYKRVWQESRLDNDSGNVETKQLTAYYPDWRYRPDARPRVIGEYPVMWDVPVYHVKVNSLSDMKFGVSEVYAAIDWAKRDRP